MSGYKSVVSSQKAECYRVQTIKGNPVRRNGHLRLYRQPDYGQVRRISPSDVPDNWKYTKALCTSHRVKNKHLRTVFVLTSNKEVKSLLFISYMEELYGYEIKTITIKPPTHCLQPRGQETLSYHYVFKFLNAFLLQFVTRSSIWCLIRMLLSFTVNFDFLFISVYDEGVAKYKHLALWRYSRQDGEESTYRSAVYCVFPDIDSKNWHKFVSRDRSEYQVKPTRA
ncbi:hypothetical protein BJX96DRAFT_165801 [Aspergillus floccosus]